MPACVFVKNHINVGCRDIQGHGNCECLPYINTIDNLGRLARLLCSLSLLVLTQTVFTVSDEHEKSGVIEGESIAPGTGIDLEVESESRLYFLEFTFCWWFPVIELLFSKFCFSYCAN